jgi:Raf kinase inhibitor-like YbhB/YbcL family protein
MRLARLAVVGLVLFAAACSSSTSSSGSAPPPPAPPAPAGNPSGAPTLGPSGSVPARTLTVTSPVFIDGGSIPKDFTCTGAGKMPGLQWKGDLKGSTALAVVVDDPDAPGGTFVHLVVVDLPAATTRLGDSLPAAAHYALNGAGRKGWTAPCPPSGTHHYRFTVYGLSAPTDLPDGSPGNDAEAAIFAKAVVQGQLIGLVSH